MRKYLIATVIGSMLLAGQAMAQAGSSDTAVVNLGDRLGATSDTGNNFNRNDSLYILAAGIAFIGIVAWGFSQNGSGRPASP